MPNCLSCGAGVDEYDSGYYSRNMMCIPCYVQKSSDSTVSCTRCGTRVRREEASRKGGSIYCSYCSSEIERVARVPECPHCREKLQSWQKSFRLANGQTVHAECAKAMQGSGSAAAAFCSFCGKQTDSFRVLPGGRATCPKCDRAGVATSHDRTIMASIMDTVGAMLG